MTNCSASSETNTQECTRKGASFFSSIDVVSCRVLWAGRSTIHDQEGHYRICQFYCAELFYYYYYYNIYAARVSIRPTTCGNVFVGIRGWVSGFSVALAQYLLCEQPHHRETILWLFAKVIKSKLIYNWVGQQFVLISRVRQWRRLVKIEVLLIYEFLSWKNAVESD